MTLERKSRRIAFAVTDPNIMSSSSISYALHWMKLHFVQEGDKIVLIYFPPNNQFRGIPFPIELHIGSIPMSGWQLLQKYSNQCESLGLEVTF